MQPSGDVTDTRRDGLEAHSGRQIKMHHSQEFTISLLQKKNVYLSTLSFCFGLTV